MNTLIKNGIKLYPVVFWENGEYKIETMRVKAENLCSDVLLRGLQGYDVEKLQNFIDKINAILEKIIIREGFAYLPYKEYKFIKKVLARYEEMHAGF